MGQGWSSRNAMLVLPADDTRHSPGDVVNAVVNLNVVKSFPCDKLKVTLTCDERVKIDGFLMQQVYRVRHLNVEHIVHEFRGMVEPGQYSFPLAFHLPEWLAPGFELRDVATKSRSSVQYALSAECHVPRRMTTRGGGKIRDRLKLPVLARAPATTEPVLLNETRSIRGVLSLVSRGEVRVNVTLDKKHYVVGDPVLASYSIVNQTGCRFPVLVSLVRKLQIRRKDGKVLRTSQVTLRTRHCAAAIERSTTNGTAVFPLSAPNNSSADFPPTSNARHTILEYEIEFRVKGSFFGRGAKVYIPIRVSGQASDLPPYPQPDATGWNPVVFEPVSFELPSAPPPAVDNDELPSYDQMWEPASPGTPAVTSNAPPPWSPPSESESEASASACAPPSNTSNASTATFVAPSTHKPCQ